MQQKLTPRSPANRAVAAALVAGACWGVSFLAPRALAETSATTITLFRFLFFGASSAVALASRKGRRPPLTRATLRIALGLSLAGYSLYYALLAVGVKGIGVPFATAIIGLLPLTIPLAATPRREWRRLGGALGLILIGGCLIPFELFGAAYAELLARTAAERALGLGATLAALALWTGFALRNARFLREHPEWDPLDWAGVLGVASAITALGISFAASGSSAGSELLAGLRSPRLLAWTGFMGIAGAWFASALWNYASRALPAAVAGMLLVFEAVFGLAFGFVYEGRGPTVREGIAAACLIAGALVGIRGIYSRERPR